ncbi:MAG: hypothetical protein V4650_09890 [Pseudomonadota bacterium]
MPYDYAPRLAARAAARRRRHLLFVLALLSLPALSFQSTRSVAEPPASTTLPLEQAAR